MPFTYATFMQHITTANPTHSRFKLSSMTNLENLLQGLGAGVNAGSLAAIQPVLAVVPHDKQVIYTNAINYLKGFVPGLVNAIPVNPQMEYVEFRVMTINLAGRPNYPARLYLVHRLSWSSSNGNIPSLNTVGTRERVTYRTAPNAAPFDPLVTAAIPMAYTQGSHDNTGGQIGENFDDHSFANPATLLARPLGLGSLIADQVYEYTTDGMTWQAIPTAQYEIETGVRMHGGHHVFYFRKQTAAPYHNRFHFEAEFTIGPHQAVPGNKVQVIPASFAQLARLQDYATRVIAAGDRA